MALEEEKGAHNHTSGKLEAGDDIVTEKSQGWDPKRHWDLDEGDEHVRYRRRW
jgi:hypothetical protein